MNSVQRTHARCWPAGLLACVTGVRPIAYPGYIERKRQIKKTEIATLPIFNADACKETDAVDSTREVNGTGRDCLLSFWYTRLERSWAKTAEARSSQKLFPDTEKTARALYDKIDMSKIPFSICVFMPFLV